MSKVSMSQLISLSRSQTKSVINFLFRELMTSWFLLDKAPKQWLTGEKRGEDGNTKIWISPERK